jgi:hypothetical protein
MDELDGRGYTDTKIVGMRADRSLIELCVEYDIEPPSITTDAGWYVPKRLCEEAGIELDDGEEYPMPHVVPDTVLVGSRASVGTRSRRPSA